MKLYTIAEPHFSRSLWVQEALQGVRNSKNGRRLSLCAGAPEADFLSAARADTGVVWLLGSSARWMRSVLPSVLEQGIYPILTGVGSVECAPPHCLITQDYARSAYTLCCRLRERGCRRIAFFGYNPDSSTDALKLTGFRAAQRECGQQADVWENRGDIVACIRAFADSAVYDGVLCANAYVCAALMRAHPIPAAGTACFGSSPLLERFNPGILHATLDYRLAGEKAAELYPYFCACGGSVTMTVSIQSGTDAPEMPASGGGADVLPMDVFYDDPPIRQMVRLESVLTAATEEDHRILDALAGGCTYEETAARCNMGVSSIKYRLRRLSDRSGYASAELLHLWRGESNA